jgi:hypothetical protein
MKLKFKYYSYSMITIECLQEKWFETEWNEKTHNGKYRTNQLEQHREISEKIFDYDF